MRKGYKHFHWYLIGSGSAAEKAIITESIHKYRMEDKVILLGEKENPYPYLKNCSLFALTSRYEAYPTVINEALTLGMPIITTNFAGVDELVAEDVAIISPIDEFLDKIEMVMKQFEYGKMDRRSRDFTIHNRVVTEKFEQLIR